MKLCCADWIVPGESYTDKCEFLQQVGVDGIEMYPDETQDLQLLQNDVQRGTQKTGTIVSAAIVLGDAFGVTMTNEGMIEEKVKLTKKAVDMTASLGSDFTIVVPEYSAQTVVPLVPMGTPSAKEQQLFIAYLQQVADYAQPLGVNILIEPINRYENHFYHKLEDVIAVCKQTGRENVKTFLDFFHANIEEASIPDTVHKCKDYIHHVHLSDSNRHLPGGGHTDLRAGFQALRQGGYDGKMTLEIPIEFVTEPRRQLGECQRYVKSLWDSAG